MRGLSILWFDLYLKPFWKKTNSIGIFKLYFTYISQEKETWRIWRYQFNSSRCCVNLSILHFLWPDFHFTLVANTGVENRIWGHWRLNSRSTILLFFAEIIGINDCFKGRTLEVDFPLGWLLYFFLRGSFLFFSCILYFLWIFQFDLSLFHLPPGCFVAECLQFLTNQWGHFPWGLIIFLAFFFYIFFIVYRYILTCFFRCLSLFIILVAISNIYPWNWLAVIHLKVFLKLFLSALLFRWLLSWPFTLFLFWISFYG